MLSTLPLNGVRLVRKKNEYTWASTFSSNLPRTMHSMSIQALTLSTLLPTEIGTLDHQNKLSLLPTYTLCVYEQHPTAVPSTAAITLLSIIPQQTPPVLLNQLGYESQALTRLRWWD